MACGPVLLSLKLIHAIEEGRRNKRVEESDVGIAFGKNISIVLMCIFFSRTDFSLAEFILLL